MNKKVLVVIIVVLFMLSSIFLIINKKEINNIETNSNNEIVGNITIGEMENGSYLITKDDGSQVYTNSIEEAEWYKEHPDYNPEPVHYEE